MPPAIRYLPPGLSRFETLSSKSSSFFRLVPFLKLLSKKLTHTATKPKTTHSSTSLNNPKCPLIPPIRTCRRHLACTLGRIDAVRRQDFNAKPRGCEDAKRFLGLSAIRVTIRWALVPQLGPGQILGTLSPPLSPLARGEREESPYIGRYIRCRFLPLRLSV